MPTTNSSTKQYTVAQSTIDRHVGSRYGRLIILSFSARRGAHYFYMCKCDCGTVKEIRIAQLQRKSENDRTRSCGCYCKERSIAAHTGNHYRRLAEGQSSFNAVMKMYREAAKRRNLDFTLTTTEFKQLTSSRCYFCDSPPSNKRRATKATYGSYVYNGVDRADNSQGYTLSNCIPCCRRCNYIKNAITKDMVFKLYHFLFPDSPNRN